MKINSNICFTELLFCLKKNPFQSSSKMGKDGWNCFTIKMVEDFSTIKHSLWMDGRCQTHSKAIKSFKELTWSDFVSKSPNFPLSMGKAVTSSRQGWALTPEQHREPLLHIPATAHGCSFPLFPQLETPPCLFQDYFPYFPMQKCVTLLLQTRINTNPTNYVGIKAELESSQMSTSEISLGVVMLSQFLIFISIA